MPPPSASPTAPALPAGWRTYRDVWNGFLLAAPPNWQIKSENGVLIVSEDAKGHCAALILPLRLPRPLSPLDLAQQYIALGRTKLPSFTAWQIPEAATATTAVLRTQANDQGVTLIGTFTFHADPSGNAMISGIQAPQGMLDTHVPILSAILGSFQMLAPMPRQPFREPGEGAFECIVPQGWMVKGGVNHQTGTPVIEFYAQRDAQGLVLAAQTNTTWTYQEGMMGMFGGFPGAQMQKYLPAPQYCLQSLAPGLAKQYPGLQVENVQERPEWIPMLAQETARGGMDPNGCEFSGATLTVGYDSGGRRIRQRNNVTVTRFGTPMGMMMGQPPIWMACLLSFFRAPADEFDQQEPTLLGILNSLRVNPAWQESYLAASRQYVAMGQMDIIRRTGEISRTLSETSDIITSSYWSQQAAYDRISHSRSNAMRGQMDVTDNSGYVYNVPHGYDQYWRDQQGYVRVGTWMATPDPTWTRLEPTGR